VGEKGREEKKKKQESVHWHGAVRQQREFSSEHSGSETAHDRLCLDMEVAQHLVGAPATDKTDDVGIDLGAKQGHSASRTKGAGTDVRGEESELGGIKWASVI
jgi:hypothetical protein